VRETFSEWLISRNYKNNTVATQGAHTRRLEKQYGDLDEAYDNDQFAEIISDLSYSKTDERDGLPNPAKISIEGNLYKNLANYRATLGYYARFRESENRETGHPASNGLLNRDALENLRKIFLGRYTDFESLGFQADHGSYWDEERGYKEDVLAGAQEILARDSTSDDEVGQAFIALLRRPPANFVGWRAFERIREAGPEAEKSVAIALGEMVNDPGEISVVAETAAEQIHALMTGGAAENPAFGHVRSLVTTTLALCRPSEAIAVKTRFMQRAAKLLAGQGPFKSRVMTSDEYREFLSLSDAIFDVLQNEWGWKPRDLWDVQGFLWAAINSMAEELEDDGSEADEDEPMPEESMENNPATNLILYGPPGTGKTYSTAAKAVELCDGHPADDDRDAVMLRYRELVERKRISFVTFHQSYAYEDFVEGLRPETNTVDEADDEPNSGGFTLRPHPGVFRRIAELARNNRGRSSSLFELDSTYSVFKMSLGESRREEDARIFREAIKGGYVVLGWGGDINWSAPEYDDFEAIKARWRKDHPDANGKDPNISQLYTLRGQMTVGDLVVISDGNKKFRAIGKVTGPYQFVQDDIIEYHHRRPVEWIWQNDEGLPCELIYGRSFSQVSAYQLDPSVIHRPALEQIIAGGSEAAKFSGAPESYVLIIDEINRANVSKVFGELITLIEPDKRLSSENELTVTLPYSGDTFGVPGNLHIIGTMNTADRSIALLDTALRRRFEFEEIAPDSSLLGSASNATDIDLKAVLEGLNTRIEYLFDRDHQIGHAFFMGCQDFRNLNHVMRTKVIPLLAEYFYENWEKVRQVLGETTNEGAFVKRIALQAPKGAEDLISDEGRWRYLVHNEFQPTAYDQLKA
jgi:5-methylcytosine-specific restriction protein B